MGLGWTTLTPPANHWNVNNQVGCAAHALCGRAPHCGLTWATDAAGFASEYSCSLLHSLVQLQIAAALGCWWIRGVHAAADCYAALILYSIFSYLRFFVEFWCAFDILDLYAQTIFDSTAVVAVIESV